MIQVRQAPPPDYPWIAKRAELVVAPNFLALEAVSRERILGMVGYDGWTPNSCVMHVAIDEPIAVRPLLKTAFVIPFVWFDKGIALASIKSSNKKSLRFSSHLGFQTIAVIKDGWAKGEGFHILEMRRENCRWLR